MTIQDFITETGITLTSEYADSNPHMEDSNRMDNYKCVLRARKLHAQMTVHFSKGIGHNGAEPTADEVLDCLASDAVGVENAGDFESWASEYGYDTDSRRAEKTFKACEREAAKLQKFLGDDYYQTLLWKIERM